MNKKTLIIIILSTLILSGCNKGVDKEQEIKVNNKELINEEKLEPLSRDQEDQINKDVDNEQKALVLLQDLETQLKNSRENNAEGNIKKEQLNEIQDIIDNIKDKEIKKRLMKQLNEYTIDMGLDKSINVDKNKEEEFSTNIYFLNKEYILTEDESFDSIISKPVVLSLKKDNKYISKEQAIVDFLLEYEYPKDEIYQSSIKKETKVNKVYIKNDTCYLDFNKKSIESYDNADEKFFINQFVGSLLELEEVNKVQFLIDGKKQKFLMGQFSIDKPFYNII